MSLGKRPRRDRIESVKMVLKATGDDARAFQIWKDFRWEVSRVDGDYSAIGDLLRKFMDRAKLEILGAVKREEVLDKFRIMLNRLSEFTDVDVYCQGCGKLLQAEDYRRNMESEIQGQVLCAMCCASSASSGEGS